MIGELEQLEWTGGARFTRFGATFRAVELSTNNENRFLLKNQYFGNYLEDIVLKIPRTTQNNHQSLGFWIK